MATLGERMQATALRLLTQYGEAVTFTRTAEGAYNPLTSTADDQLNTLTDQIIIRNIGRISATRDRAWYRGSVEVNFDVFTD